MEMFVRAGRGSAPYARSEDRPFPRGWLLPPGLGRWVLLATAALQAVSPALIPFGASGDEPPVVPAGYAFSIWSVIVLGCAAAALWGLPARRARSAAYRAVQLRLSVVQVLFVAWLLAATSSAVWLTVPIFATMLALTLAALRRVLVATAAAPGAPAGERRRLRVTRWLLGGSLGVYAGWSTAAVWVNLATLLSPARLSPEGPLGTAWQTAVLVAATASAVVVVRRLAAPPPYVAAVAWAFVGVVVSALMAGLPGLTAAAVAGLVAVLGAAVVTRRTGRARPTSIA